MEIFNGVQLVRTSAGRVKIMNSIILSKEDIPLFVEALQKELKNARQLQKQQIQDRISSHEEELVKLKADLADLKNK